MLRTALVLVLSLLLPCGGAPVDPATETPADAQVGSSEDYIPRLLMLLSDIKDAEQDSNRMPFGGTLLDGDGPMKRQEENAEVVTVKQSKRKEGCKVFYYKTWTAC